MSDMSLRLILIWEQAKNVEDQLESIGLDGIHTMEQIFEELESEFIEFGLIPPGYPEDWLNEDD